MVFSELRAVVGADGEESDFGAKLFSNFTKSWKVTRIACVVDRSSPHIDDVASVATMVVGDLAGSPMLGGDKGDGGTWKAKAFPPVNFVHFFKA